YGGVTVGIERGDGTAEGVASNTTRWSADGVVHHWGRDDAHSGVAGNRAGDRIDGDEALAAGGLESGSVAKNVHAAISVHEGVISRQRGLCVAAGNVDRAGVARGRATGRIHGADGTADRVASNATRRSAEAVVRRAGRADAYHGVAGKRAGDGIVGRDVLAARGREDNSIAKG